MSLNKLEKMHYNVFKIPRSRPAPDIPINFKPFDNLHLELLENPKKIKPGLPLIPRNRPRPQQNIVNTPEPDKEDTLSIDIIPVAAAVAGGIIAKKKGKKQPIKEHFTESKPPKKQSVIKTLLDSSGDESTTDDDDKDFMKKFSEKSKKKKKISPPKFEDEPEESDRTENSDDVDDDDDNDDEDDDDEGDDSNADIENDEDDEEGEEGETSGKNTPKTSSTEEDEYDPYAGLSPEEREEKEKQEYLWKFDVLKRSYPRFRTEITFNEHSDLHTMKLAYQKAIREVKLDENVKSYRRYLGFCFLGMEWLCVHYFGIEEFDQFANSQLKIMDEYDVLLIELGEKQYNSWTSNLPVEIRLLGLVVFQAIIFYIIKMIAKNKGDMAAEMFRNMVGAKNIPISEAEDESSTPEPAPAPRRMRGPTIRP